MDRDELNIILKEHEKWLRDEGGARADLWYADLQNADLRNANLQSADLRCANLQNANLRNAILENAGLQNANLQHASLRYADLRYANLQHADLRYADLDFSALPLWCGSLGMKVDARIARQIAYHFCRLDCEDPEYLAAKAMIAPFANKFHRVDECGAIEIREDTE